MPADRSTSGTGPRRQGSTEARRTEDRVSNRERALEREREMGAVDTVHDPGRQPGAHGNDSPHRNVKPGTRLDLEQANPERAGED